MRVSTPAKLLRLHISERDRFEGKPLYQAVVEKCRELKIAGATVFRGLEGYGETAGIHRAHLIGLRDQPIVVTIIDTAKNLGRLLPVVEGMMDKGLIATSDVECVRVTKSEP
jgi:PII-like signaling protein